MTQSLQDLSLLTTMDSFHNLGAAVVEPTTGALLWHNPQLAQWLTLSECASPNTSVILPDCWQLPPKVISPLPLPAERLNQPIPSHLISQPQPASGEVLKFKVSYQWLPDALLLLLVEPFAEDVALTSMHSDFVSTVSHEFRTPLTSIKGFADTLLRYGAQLPPEQSRRFITIIKDQADRLTRLVENLLSVSKVGGGQLDVMVRPVDLAKVLERILHTLKAKGVGSRQFSVRVARHLPDLWVDPDRLEQILLNLLDNAIKYSPDHTTVHVEAAANAQNPETAKILIRDEGVGIDAEHLPHIFTKFSRIDNPLTRTAEGTGLGLFITKSLTLALAGTIHVESCTDESQGRGTTFVLTFPLATAERQEAYRRRLLVEGE